MEAKTTRAAAMAALCVLLSLLSTMPGKAAPERPTLSDFCKCYRPCYAECRRNVSKRWRFICVAKCFDDCSPHKLAAGGDPCTVACAGVNTICDTSESEPAPDRDDAAGETAACVRGCNMWMQHRHSTK